MAVTFQRAEDVYPSVEPRLLVHARLVDARVEEDVLYSGYRVEHKTVRCLSEHGAIFLVVLVSSKMTLSSQCVVAAVAVAEPGKNRPGVLAQGV